MVNPLIPGVILVLAVSVTALMWVVGTPIVETFFDNISPDLDARATPAVNTALTLWYVIPLLICILTAIWFLMVITKRQVVTQGGIF